MNDRAQTPAEPPEIPGYEFLRLIGEGGMAAVWAARQKALDRVVAVKIFRRGGADPEWVSRFQAEARTAARLVHPGIVQIYDAGEAGDFLYYVMELVEGCTVAELIQIKGRLQERHALAVALGVAEALRYAWDKAGIIHCDVKPANILIDREGVVRVTDLGLSRSAYSRPLAEEAEIAGTPNYASPEQAGGEERLDFRTDIYSLGATLYHMVTGRLPFGEYPPLEVLRCQQEGFLPDPAELNPELSPAAAWLIEKMMMRDRRNRYGSWDAVVEDIEAVRERGVLKSSLPAAGGSTVQRSPHRKPPQPRRRAAPEPEPHAAAPGGAGEEKRRVVLPKDLKERGGLREEALSLDAAYPFLRFFVVLAAAICVYGLLGYLAARHRPPPATVSRPAEAPRRVRTVKKVVWEEKPVARMVAAEKTPPAAPPPGQPAKKTVAWRDPRFLAGARAFNHAYAAFRRYAVEQGDPRQLQMIEEEVREAIRAFEQCREEAPPEVNVGELVDRCYHLLADIRQTMLTAPPAEAAGPARRTAPAELPPAPRLALQAGWDRVVPSKSQVVDDLYELLFEHGEPVAELEGPRGLVIFDEIRYLMPATEALSILGSRTRRRKAVSSPAFPPNSFYYYEVEGDFGEGFTSLQLLTDVKDQVVAVQLADNTTREELWLNPALFSTEWRAYDFIRGRQRATPKWKIAHEVDDRGGILCIRTELADRDPEGYFQLGASRARVMLLLPKPVVNLLLYYIQRQRNLIPRSATG